MDSPVNLHLELDRGAKAEHLLRNELYVECIGKVRQGIYEKFATSPVGDKDGQHELRLMLKCLDDVEANIREIATTGKMAAKQIEEERTLKERAKSAIHAFRR